MFETLSHLALQQYWWVIISLLAAILAFLLFVQGGQTLLYQVGKTDTQRTMLVNTLGRKWELTFTTLVTFGGAFFASFPLFYSTSFGGAYWVWMLILFGFILQAVSYEYRKKPNNFLGHKTFEVFLFINGLLATVLIGAAISTFFTGSEFSVNDFNQSRWEDKGMGLEAALNVQNLALGLAVFFLSRVLGALYFILTISEETIVKNSVKQVIYNAVPFLVFFLLFVGLLITKEGFAVKEDGTVFMEAGKYLNNFIDMPLVLALFLIGVLAVLYGLFTAISKKYDKSFWIVSIGVILVVFSLFLIAGFNGTAFYPSTFNLQDSLTIQNASSSHYTLSAMSYVSLAVPFVIAYIWYAWRSINNKKIDLAEIEEGELKY
ncbi:MAG: cytochrome d ubiquinol oxidase subunit II [Bacteroidetes bacterium GWF2_38_335]|nr:MAG: cytochrome d ubiquinol oxidase subunit II [Bacteroidetes bacterium GWF2_38_335]OFY80477.1 MAG: cytochrome d ubiquinol oxidase subunit II [Bacteroidetes bacterium RIFOXYA12_FULL_38_20]HBS85915.1 cytochrome d ubiquinol oxidase subunit II [Bacteroidales bacterium]